MPFSENLENRHIWYGTMRRIYRASRLVRHDVGSKYLGTRNIRGLVTHRRISHADYAVPWHRAAVGRGRLFSVISAVYIFSGGGNILDSPTDSGHGGGRDKAGGTHARYTLHKI